MILYHIDIIIFNIASGRHSSATAMYHVFDCQLYRLIYSKGRLHIKRPRLIAGDQAEMYRLALMSHIAREVVLSSSGSI